MIRLLQNPKTKEYQHFKSFILSSEFTWFRFQSTLIDSNHTFDAFFGHTILVAPNVPDSNQYRPRYSKSNSPYIDNCEYVINQIIEFNNLDVSYILRMNVNLTYPIPGVKQSPPHVDHPFPHKNMLIYLTDAGGETVVGNESHNPREDDIIIFGGEEHFHYYPQQKNRIVLVVTYV